MTCGYKITSCCNETLLRLVKGRAIARLEIRDITANLLTEVCHDVSVEPGWRRQTWCLSERLLGRTSWENVYRCIQPACSHEQNSSISIKLLQKTWKHENEFMKKELQILNSHPSLYYILLTPLILSATGGMAKQSTIFYKRLASLVAEKWDQPYSSTLYWLRVRLSFSLLRSAIQGHALPGVMPRGPPPQLI